LSSGDWDEERQIQVTSDKPVEVEFQRSWNGKRRITGRLMFDGAPYTPSPTLVARAWRTPHPLLRFPTLAFEPVVHPNGSFEVAFDAESASLFFVDRDQQRSGFAKKVHGDTDVDVTLEATATYSGTLLDDNAQPVAGCTLEMYVEPSDNKPVAAQQTDKAGRFRFTGVPSHVALEIRNRPEIGGPDCYVVDGDRMFNPDEVRENDQLKLHLRDPVSPNVRSAVPLAQRVETICRNAHSAGMRTLVALLGDDSGDAARTIDQLFDYDNARTRAVLSYLTLRVDSTQLKREAATVTRYGWPKPAPGEIVLVALDGDQKMIAAQRLATNPVAAGVDRGVAFLNGHRLPPRNALTLLAEARRDAKRSGRRVWVIQGGPRCGSCFQLTRWIEDHRATLDKDYVIVKLMEGIDEHVKEAVAGLPIEDRDGIPWFAITEPDGTVLAISRGPLGNIGFPASVKGIRHFRQMLDRTVQRMTPNDVDRLISSLSAGR
jgi:hypothetical protein